MKVFFGSEQAAKAISIDNRLMIVALYTALEKKGVITEDEFVHEYELQKKFTKDYLESLPTVPNYDIDN